MNLKYKVADVEKMIDVFSSIEQNRTNPGEVIEQMTKLIEYPVYIVQEFLNCIDALSKTNHDEGYLKKNYYGVIGYIVLRLNIATEDSVKFPPEDM